MKLRYTLFRSAMARIFASASSSVMAAGSASGAVSLIDFGTMASTRPSSDGAPTTFSISAISSSLGPMWRAWNSLWFSSWASVVMGLCVC